MTAPATPSTPANAFSIQPLECSAPTAPAPRRRSRQLLLPHEQKQAKDSFHASWPAARGKGFKHPHLDLFGGKDEETNKSVPSPIAKLAFQSAFQKMKTASSVKKSTPAA